MSDFYDTNGNGLADTYTVDGDRYAETLAFDTDENGIIDVVQVDTDLDGVLDTSGVDVDQDGVIDYRVGPDGVAAPVNPYPLAGDPGVIGGGADNPLIDALPFATPGQTEQITDILESQNDAIRNQLGLDDDD